MSQKTATLCDDTCCTCDSSLSIIELVAKLPDGSLEPPVAIGDPFYGTSRIAPELAFASGIPVKGYCIDLLRHARRGYETAFRGTTPRPMVSHGQAQGAIFWADVDGWVYELGDMTGWELEKLLEGKVPWMGTYTNAPYPGELECSVDSRILPTMIRRAAKVLMGRRNLELGEWQKNRNYRPAASRS